MDKDFGQGDSIITIVQRQPRAPEVVAPEPEPEPVVVLDVVVDDDTPEPEPVVAPVKPARKRKAT